MKILKKMQYFALFAMIGALGLSSCQKEEITSIEPNSVETPKEDINIISELGFNTDNLVNVGSHYLVENDILLKKDKLKSYLSKKTDPRLKQARVANLISYNNSFSTITVRADESIPATGADNWRNEIQQAINHWNRIASCRIKLEYTTANTADITIRSDEGIPNVPRLNDGSWININGTWYWTWVLAAAEWPVNGVAGEMIRINLDTDNDREITLSQKVYNIVHEIGHCLGLRHTDWQNNESAWPGIHIEGTPSVDNSSVMNSGTALNSWYRFSRFDEVAISTMYPSLKPTLFYKAYTSYVELSSAVYVDLHPIIEKGFCYKFSGTSSPTIYDTKIVKGSGAGIVSHNVYANIGDTPTAIRAYIKTSQGITYSRTYFCIRTPYGWQMM